MNSCRRHIRSAQLEIVEVVVETRSPATDVAVPEVLRDAVDAQQLHVPWSERVQIILEAHVIGDRVGRNVLGSSSRKNGLPIDAVSGG